MFIWKNGRPQAQDSYNDDLVMSWGTALFLRDTTLRFKQAGQDLSRAALNSMGKSEAGYQVYQTNNPNYQNPWEIKNPYGESEDIKWLL